MNVIVVAEDSIISIDGDSVNINLGLPANIWAIHWDGQKGHVEYNDATPNLDIDDFVEFEYLIEAHANEKTRIQVENDKTEADRLAAMTYADHRSNEYPSLEDQLDDIFHNGLDGWKANIQLIKDKYPKGDI